MKKIILSIVASRRLPAGVPGSYGRAPDLGVATSCALCTANGDYNNTLITKVTAGIGTSAGELTGFHPGALTCISHVAASASEDAAKNVASAQWPYGQRSDTGLAGPAPLRLTEVLGHLVAGRQLRPFMGSSLLALEAATAPSPGRYLLQVTKGALRRTIRPERE
jgi:hypothetical protein